MGSIDGTFDFDPGPGTDLRTSPSTDVFVVKLTAAGELAWPPAMLKSQPGFAPDDTIWMVGMFAQTRDFDPGDGVAIRTSRQRDAFVLRLNAFGNFLDVMVFGGAGLDTAYDIALATDGTAYVSGTFADGLDFDPGLGVVTRAEADGNCFVVRLGADDRLISVHTLAQLDARHAFRAVAGAGLLFLDSQQGGGLNHLTGDRATWRIPLPGILTAVGPAILGVYSNGFGLGGQFINSVDFDPGAARDNFTAVTPNGDQLVSRYAF